MNKLHDQKKTLNKRLESIGWALFLIMIGCLWLMPEGTVPEHTWLLGVGVIMIVLNLVRLTVGIKASGFTLIVAVLAIGMGLGDIYNVKIPVIPILAILAGLGIIFKPLLAKKNTSDPTDPDD